MSFNPTHIVVHLSASTWGTVADVRAWHKARGFSDIGYHLLITNGFLGSELEYDASVDGKVWTGRSERIEGAHCRAAGMNSKALGICCIGNPGWTPEGPEYLKAGRFGRTVVRPYMTVKQHAALVEQLAQWCDHYDIPVSNISQHSDHDGGKPLCASLNITILRKQVTARLRER
jgi:hypothetical protein